MAFDLTNLLQRLNEAPGMDLWISEGRVPFLKGMGKVTLLGAESVERGSLVPALLPRMERKARRDWDSKGSCRFRLPGVAGTSSRVDLCRESQGALAVFRSTLSELPSLDAIRVPQGVKSLLHNRNGLVLFCGPGASGVTTLSTAFAAALCAGRSLRVRVLDADPEWALPAGRSLLVRGLPVGSLREDIRASLASGTDLFVFGDIEPGDIDSVLEACEGGALAIANLHASSTLHALERLGCNSHLFHRVLRGVVGCHRIPDVQGTEQVQAWDVLIATNQVVQALESGDLQKLPQIQKSASQDGMVNLDDALALLVSQGRIAKSEARLRAHEPSPFE